jgi:SAM-dependent methyltransferase
VKYWEIRATKYGRRAVLNLGRRDDEFDVTTEMQKGEMYPLFVSCLKGTDRTVLDFGCGVGRFTPDLAVMTGGFAIGVDPIRLFLEMAPKAENVGYALMNDGIIPLRDHCIDVVWICLVLGGIRGEMMDRTVSEINRVLKIDGLLFLVENTSTTRASETWNFMQLGEIQAMFPFVSFNHLHDYYDLDERISIIAGRKTS